MRFKHCGGLSPHEIKNYLNDRNKLKKFTDNMLPFKKVLDEVKTRVDAGQKIVNALCYLTYVGSSKKIEINSKLPESVAIRNDMKEGVRQMNALINAAAVFKDCVPPGMNDYIEYNLAAFNAAQVVFTIADQYCSRIEKEAEETAREWQKTNTEPESKENVHNGIMKDTRKSGPDAPYLLY